MDYPDSSIESIVLVENIMNITYTNGNVEVLPINCATYKMMYDKWILETPVFITDIYKVEMRNLSFATCQNKHSSINQLNQFFSSDNLANVKLFLTYMRNRKQKIQNDKAKLLK